MGHALASLITTDVGSTVFVSLAIILSGMVFEDITSIVIGVLASEGVVSVPLALGSLLVGIMLGDVALYLMGRWACASPFLSRYAHHEFTGSFRTWLERHYPAIIFSGHFVPGLRFATYSASGFFRRPLSSYIPLAIASGLLLGSGLFAIAYWFSTSTTHWMRPVRWGLAAIVICILVVVSRNGYRALRTDESALTASK